MMMMVMVMLMMLMIMVISIWGWWIKWMSFKQLEPPCRTGIRMLFSLFKTFWANHHLTTSQFKFKVFMTWYELSLLWRQWMFTCLQFKRFVTLIITITIAIAISISITTMFTKESWCLFNLGRLHWVFWWCPQTFRSFLLKRTWEYRWWYQWWHWKPCHHLFWHVEKWSCRKGWWQC